MRGRGLALQRRVGVAGWGMCGGWCHHTAMQTTGGLCPPHPPAPHSSAPDVWAACAAGLAPRANGRFTFGLALRGGACAEAGAIIQPCKRRWACAPRTPPLRTHRPSMYGRRVPRGLPRGPMGASHSGWLVPSSSHANDGGQPPAPPAPRPSGPDEWAACAAGLCPAGQWALRGRGDDGGMRGESALSGYSMAISNRRGNAMETDDERE